jgi:hypothetical protein
MKIRFMLSQIMNIAEEKDHMKARWPREILPIQEAFQELNIIKLKEAIV